MDLIRKLFFLALFVAATFAFTVLFQYGTDNFAGNAEREFAAAKETLEKWQAGGKAPAR